MKITMNVFLAFVLFCSAVLAGDQGNGGRSGNVPAETCTTSTSLEGDQGNGGRYANEPTGTCATSSSLEGDQGNGGRAGTGTTSTSVDMVIVAVVKQYLGLGF